MFVFCAFQCFVFCLFFWRVLVQVGLRRESGCVWVSRSAPALLSTCEVSQLFLLALPPVCVVCVVCCAVCCVRRVVFCVWVVLCCMLCVVYFVWVSRSAPASQFYLCSASQLLLVLPPPCLPSQWLHWLQAGTSPNPTCVSCPPLLLPNPPRPITQVKMRPIRPFHDHTFSISQGIDGVSELKWCGSKDLWIEQLEEAAICERTVMSNLWRMSWLFWVLWFAVIFIWGKRNLKAVSRFLRTVPKEWVLGGSLWSKNEGGV